MLFLLFFYFYIFLFSQVSSDELVYIDTDPGIDDAYAIFMAFRADRNPSIPYKVIGISTVNGNTKIKNANINVARILNTIDEKTLKIDSGVESALIESKTLIDDPPFYGEDGFGDGGFPNISTRNSDIFGPQAIINALVEHKGNLTILCLGPLTNLAIAVKMNPMIKSYPKRIIILGGTINGAGNSKIATEFNFGIDPEAARIVLETYKCPITILPWEACSDAYSTYDFRVSKLGKLGTNETKFLNQAEAKNLEANKENWLMSDSIVSAISIEPDIILKSEDHYMTVELDGEFTRGMGIVDRMKLLNKEPNVKIVTEIDRILYEDMLIWSVGGPYYKSLTNGGARSDFIGHDKLMKEPA